MKDILSQPGVLSTMISVTGSGNSSFGHASLRFRKSMQMRIDPFFLVTGTIFETQSGCCSSRINPEPITFGPFCSLASILSARKRFWGFLGGSPPPRRGGPSGRAIERYTVDQQREQFLIEPAGELVFIATPFRGEPHL